jgi:hypothetical protein
VKGTIVLPSPSDLNVATIEGENRTACISLTAFGGISAVDLGVENEGNEWFPFFWEEAR